MKRLLIKILLFALGLVAVERFCYKQTGGFMVSKILTHLPASSIWHVEPPSPREKEKLLELLAQPFHFLGKGNECYAFVSEDQTTVLKFFKHQLIRLPFLHAALLSLPQATFFEGVSHARSQRLKRSFISCKIAYDHFKEETGLIALNLSRDWKVGKQVTLIDRLGIAHKVDLDQTEFIVQKRATLARQTFKELMRANKHQEAIQHLEAILTIIHKRAQAGYTDRDPRPLDNFGFLGDRAIEIDIGSFLPDTNCKKSGAFKELFLYDVDEMKLWLKKDYPELLEPIDEITQRMIAHDT